MGGALERQGRHVLLLAALLAGLWGVTRFEAVRSGRLGGLETIRWLALAAAVPVAHQGFVALVWRLELHGQRVTRALGRRAFSLYAVVFATLLVGRLVTIELLALSNHGSLTSGGAWSDALALLAALLFVWTLASVARHFGVRRAFGIDHFEASWRAMPVPRRGAFRVVDNAMYTFGFAGLWLPGLVHRSVAALAVAAFSHLYVWVHYHCTEKPDLARLYPPEVLRPASRVDA